MDPFLDINDARVLQQLQQLALVSNSGKLAPAFRAIGQVMKTSTQLRFRAQRGPDGSPWRRVRRGGQALRLTGRLRNSITYRADRSGVEVGTNVVYARAHQFGLNEDQQVKPHHRLIQEAFGRALRFPVWTTVGAFSRRMRLWARPYLGFGQEDIEDIGDILGDYLRRMAGAGP